MKEIISIFIFTIFSQMSALANGDHYSNSGKLMTVVGCVSVLLIGVVMFLFYLERRVSKMEKESGLRND